MRRIALAAAVILAAVTNLWAQGQLPAWNVLGNPSAAASNARSASINQILNGAFGCTNGQLLLRGASLWGCVGIGTGLSTGGGNLNISNQITAAGPVGSATAIPIITYNAQGQLTTVSTAPISGVPSIANTHILANTSGGSAVPVDTSGTTWFDSAYCSTLGWLIARTTGAWTCAQGFPLNIEWFGASVGGSAASNVTAINAALTAAPVSSTILAPRAGYQINANIVISKTLTFSCAPSDPNVAATFIQTTTSANGVTIRANYVTIDGCTTAIAGTPSGAATGFVIGDDAIRKVSGGAFVSGNATLTCPACTFSAGTDVGKGVWAAGVGAAGAPLMTSIASVTDATHVVLALAPGGSNATATFSYGFNYVENKLLRVEAANWITGIQKTSGQRTHIHFSRAYAKNALVLQNILWGDSGDDFVSNNTFQSNDNAAGTAVTYSSGGALKFDNNKVIGGLECFLISWNLEASNGPFMHNNSIEGPCSHGINNSSTTALGAAVIDGNEIGISGTPFFSSPSVTMSAWTVANNVLRTQTGNTGMDIANLTNATVVNNTVSDIDASGGTGIVIRATASGKFTMGWTDATKTTHVSLSTAAVIIDEQGVTFANLSATAANGSHVFVSNGTPGTTPCTGGSTGVTAFRQNGVWSCGFGDAPLSISARFGGFDVWQRLVNAATTIAVPASTTFQYVNDGWFLLTGANQASTVTQVTGIATGSQFAAKVQRNSGQTGTGVMRYAVPLFLDEISLLRGSNVALSFTMLEGANQSFSHTVTYTVYCGTAAPAKRGAVAYTGETSVIVGAVTTTTSAARTTFTSAAVIPSNCAQMEIQFSWTPSGTAGADDSFTVDDLNLETVTSSASLGSPFPRWSYSEQLDKARAVFRILAGNQASTRIYPGLTESTSMISIGGPLAPVMKSAPAISFVGTASNVSCNDLAVNAAFQGTFGSNFSSPATYGLQLNCAATMTAGKAGFLNFSASAAEAFFLSSEL